MKNTVGEVLYNDIVAGTLRQTSTGFVFRYHPNYLLSAHPPISLTLPKQQASFVAPGLFAFFAGLLADIVGHEPAIEALLEKSLLPAELREQCANTLASRRQRLRYPLAGVK